MLRTLLILPLCLWLTTASAVNLDSLWGVWNDSTQADTNRLKAMEKIAWDGYLFTQPDSAFYFAQLQYDLAESINNKKTIKTASDFQARSKIYANSVNSWENYKNFFKDLFNNLPK